MPEGDTVWLTAQTLHRALAGKVLRRSDFRLPALATADVSGTTVTEVVARGKHILIRLSDGRTLHSHLRMDGAWRTRPAGPAHEVRVVLETGDTVAVGLRVHDVALLPTGREAELVGHLGPDTCGDDWDLAEAVRRTGADPAREIGPALLDQRNLAGIGNLYKSEALFLRGLTPWTPVGEIGDLAALLSLAQRLVASNKRHWSQPTTGDMRPGRDHWVFERGGRPCRRCGTAIRVAEQAEADHPERARLCYWCPHCQRGPAP